MDTNKRGMGIILHSGSYDRIHHGVTVALTALAMGRDVKLFFTYWALEYLRKGKLPVLKLEDENKDRERILKDSMDKGHLKEISELLTQAKEIGAKFYACVSSMALLNISRDELIDEVDKTAGIATFLMETREDQILFI